MLFHGGGGEKANPYDAKRARVFAKHGYGALIYSARGHGASGGETTVAGPAEMRDLFDVGAWALGLGGRDEPEHPDFELIAAGSLDGASRRADLYEPRAGPPQGP